MKMPNAPTEDSLADPRHDEAGALAAIKAAHARPRTPTYDELRNFVLGHKNPDGTRQGPPADIAVLRKPRPKLGRPRAADRKGKRPKYSSALQRRVYVAIVVDPAKRAKAKTTRIQAGDRTRQEVAKFIEQYVANGIDRRRWVGLMLGERKIGCGESAIRQAIRKLGF